MLFILDKLFILFIYTNVLTSKLVIGGVAVNKALFVAILAVYLVYFVTHRAVVPKRAFHYVYISIMFVAILASISLMKGNKLENVTMYVMPILVLISVPAVYSLLGKYRIDRYLAHFALAIVLLSLFVFLLYFLTVDDRSIGYLVNDIGGNVTVAYPNLGFSEDSSANIRVFVKTGGFFPAGLLLLYYFMKKNRRLLYIAPMLVVAAATFLNQTFTVLASAAMVLSIYIWTLVESRRRKAVMGVLLLGVILIGLSSYLASVSSYKSGSIAQKRTQVEKGIAVFVKKPLLGEGLGHLFYDMDNRGIQHTRLEVSYILILASTGVVGFMFYMFIYLYYPLLIVARRNMSNSMLAIVLAQIAIIIAGAGNPYIWSAGLGLIFVVLMVAYHERCRMDEKAEKCNPAERIS